MWAHGTIFGAVLKLIETKMKYKIRKLQDGTVSVSQNFKNIHVGKLFSECIEWNRFFFNSFYIQLCLSMRLIFKFVWLFFLVNIRFGKLTFFYWFQFQPAEENVKILWLYQELLGLIRDVLFEFSWCLFSISFIYSSGFFCQISAIEVYLKTRQ